ncbi:ATP-binding protein [Dankookia sp. P2]|uniref:sensor histidine kinase n=1 Tax=Dankookia sp. P2 TaxID=3423955 RepID=UPI003D6777E7
MAETGPWFRTRVLHDGLAVDARLHRLELPGLRLLVGRDETERTELRRLLTEGVVWASGAVVLFALAGAWLIRHALQARMRPAFTTTAAIAGGDLSSRVALSGSGDEFDRLAQTLNIMLDRIGTLMEGVRGVSDAIAHDLRTPIARARAKLEDALATSEDEESLRATVEQGIADLDAISRIFQALLRIAEAEAGARRAAFAPLDLVHVLADAAEIYEATAEARGLRLETKLPERLPMVGDRDLLLQAVANLLDNAIDSPRPRAPCCSRPLRPRPGSRSWWRMTDPAFRPRTGPMPGSASSAPIRRAPPGSGLGLSLVRAVAHLHGGEVALEDAVPGRVPPGLRVVIRLPRG